MRLKLGRGPDKTHEEVGHATDPKGAERRRASPPGPLLAQGRPLTSKPLLPIPDRSGECAEAAAAPCLPHLALIVVGFPSSPMKTTRILTGVVPLLKA